MEIALAIIGCLTALFGMLTAFFQMKAETSKRNEEKHVRQPVAASYSEYQQDNHISQGTEKLPNLPSQENLMHGLSIVFAIFLPPFAVYIKRGIGTQFWVNVFLTLFLSIFLYIPGPVHALYIVLTSKK